MNYTEYEEWVKQAAEAASEEERFAFAIETIRALNLEARAASLRMRVATLLPVCLADV